VLISVIDNGTGMPRELDAAPFEPAQRRRAHSAGAGLGLSISKGIVEAHGGRIELHRLARGTCFRISLPVEAAERPTADSDGKDADHGADGSAVVAISSQNGFGQDD
jgi:signal transduction histidine kinase